MTRAIRAHLKDTYAMIVYQNKSYECSEGVGLVWVNRVCYGAMGEKKDVMDEMKDANRCTKRKINLEIAEKIFDVT